MLKTSPSRSSRITLSQGAQLGHDCIVGSDVNVMERASVKRSCIGRGTNIGKNAKIVGCVIMEEVEIGEGAKLDNCIISSKAVIGEGAQLKDCEVGPGYMVEKETPAKGEKLGNE